MKTFKIPVIWQEWGLMEVKANSLDEAIKKVENSEEPLPEEGEYIQDSYEVDYEGTKIYNDKNGVRK